MNEDIKKNKGILELKNTLTNKMEVTKERVNL